MHKCYPFHYYLFLLQMLFVRHQWCQKAVRKSTRVAGWRLMDYFPAELILLADRNSSLPSHTFPAVEMNHFSLTMHEEYCSTEPAIKTLASVILKKEEKKGPRRIRSLTCDKLSFKEMLFKGSRCCLSIKLLPGAFKVLCCPLHGAHGGGKALAALI